MKKPIIIGVIVFASVLGVISFLIQQRLSQSEKEKEEKITHELNSVKERLSASLRYSLSATKTLAFLSKEGGTLIDFENSAKEIIGSNEFIDALELTEVGVITHVYPLRGNESVIGYDILKDSLRNIEAFKSIETKKLFFAGPLQLKQGGIAIIGRLPIFHQNQFKGFSVVLIKMKTLLKAAGIDTSQQSSFHYQFSKTDPNTLREEFFLKASVPKDNQDVRIVTLPEGDWKLYVWLKNNSYYSFNYVLISLLGLAFSIVAGLYAHQLAERYTQIKELAKEAEKKADAANRLYRVINKINKLIVRATEEKTLFEEAGKILVEEGKFRMAWIGLLDETKMILADVMHAGYEKDYLKVFKQIKLNDLILSGGPSGTAFKTGKYVVCNDIENDPCMKPWVEEALKRDYRSSISLPVKKFGTVIGTFTIYASIKNYFDLKEIDLLEQTTKDISFALQNFDKDKKQKEAENKLRSAYIENENTLNRISDSVVSVDRNWRYTFLNEAALATHPQGREKTLGHIMWDVHPEMRGTIFWNKYHEAMETGRVTEVESYYAPLNICFSVKVYPSSDGVTIFYKDVTQQKKKEILLEENEQKLSLIFDTTVDIIFLISVKGDEYFFSKVNKAFLAAVGISEEQVIGRSIKEIIPEPSLSLVLENYKNSIASRQTVTWEETTQYGNDQRTGIVSITPHFNQAGTCDLLVGSVHDITKLEKAEEQNALSAAIVNTSDDAIISKTLEGIITSWNHGAEKVFGYKPSEIIGKHITTLIPSHLHHEEEAIIAKIKNGEIIQHYETERKKKNGEIIFVSLTISPLKDANRKIIGASKILRDITGRRKTELLLTQYAQELQRSNKELEQFAYIASHDLQEPLRMVGSYMQLLERRYKGKLDEDANQFIHFAVDGANRMKQLINDLLSYSRLHREGETEQVNLNDVLKVVLQNLSSTLQENKAVVTLSNLPTISGYRTQMIQLFQNLISNAVKFKREGTAPSVNVKSEKQNDQWLFSISDNGIGIEQQYAEIVFVIFRQLHTKVKYGGTGIGLAIVKKIVERHGGNIWFESEIGKGTTFHFTLNS